MDVFSALSDPTRRQIVETLAGGEAAFGDLASHFEMSRPAVSQHLKVLKEAGIVVSRPDAQRRIYRLGDDALNELDEWMRKVRGYWNARLDRLENALAAADNEETRQ